MSPSKQSPKVSTTDDIPTVFLTSALVIGAYLDVRIINGTRRISQLPNSKTLWIEDVLSSRMRACWADYLPDLYRRKTAYILDIPERMLRRLGLSVTESVYAARIGADSPPDQYPTQNLKYQCVRVDHVGAASTSDAPRPKTLGILDVPERFYKRFGPPIAERVHAVHVGDASPPDQPPT
ncbi:hypothetical protein B0H14DRAFT_3777268 [Mycena olivaceomarginata]|nr:hypothetical protein B0H14DRAFT_3777268 [Mycena olivaceomarginata]